MRQFLDRELKGQVLLLDSPSQVVEAGYRAYQESYHGNDMGGSWQGRKFGSHEGVLSGLTRPWEEGLRVMDEFRRKLTQALPDPESVRRQPVWGDQVGQVDPHRLLAGDPVMFRDVRRRRTVAPKNVALLCNTAENCHMTAEQITWRGAAAVAAVDLLEAAGYSVEFWIWNRGEYAFSGSCPRWFMAARCKACGDPLDVDLLLNAISAWYFRMICIGLVSSRELGFAQRDIGYGYWSAVSTLSGFDKHLDVTENITVVHMSSPTSPEGAVQAALKVLQDATKSEVA